MSSARSRWAIEPGPCQPVSTSTTPSPAARAQALPWGTPGHGSGTRRRQTPGSTRSPRPSSRDGKGAWIDAYVDNMAIAAQLGVLPPPDSKAQERMTKLVNVRTRMAAKSAGKLEDVAEGVWLLRGGFPGKTMNVYFVRDG